MKTLLLSLVTLLGAIDSHADTRITVKQTSETLNCSSYEKLVKSFTDKDFDLRVIDCTETVKEKVFGKKTIADVTIEGPDFSNCNSDQVKIVLTEPSVTILALLRDFGLESLAMKQFRDYHMLIFAPPIDCL